MKSLLFCFVMFAAPLTQNAPDMSGVTKALRTGDAAALAAYFTADVELAILDDEDLYSKEEAEKILAKFFSSNPSKSFSQIHVGSSKGENSHYVIGELVAGTGTYRTYVYLKETGNSFQIEEIRIEK